MQRYRGSCWEADQAQLPWAGAACNLNELGSTRGRGNLQVGAVLDAGGAGVKRARRPGPAPLGGRLRRKVAQRLQPGPHAQLAPDWGNFRLSGIVRLMSRPGLAARQHSFQDTLPVVAPLTQLADVRTELHDPNSLHKC